MLIDIKDKICLITGSSRGLGRKLAIKLAKEGAKLIINYNHSKKEAYSLLKFIRKKYSSECIVVKADITKEKEVKKLYKQTIDYFGKIDVLINNAGIICDKDITDMKYRQWKEVLNVNISGIFLCSKYFSKNMIQNGNGKILNIGSIKGVNGNKNQSNYSASKAAVIGFTKSLAKDLGDANISVNCICPNFIITDLNRNTPLKLKIAEKQSVLSLESAVKDFLNFMVFLISDCFKGVSGQVFVLDSRIN